MENSIEKEEEILNNIKAYMQENIDKGYHKFVYNDLGHDEKCVDVINAIEHILSDYKRVLKENEELKIKNNAIKRESEAYAEDMIRLDNELNLEKEKSKYEWIRQNCLSQELVNKLYIPIQKVKDKMEYLDNQQKQWLEDRELKENDSEIIFARDILKELLGKE